MLVLVSVVLNCSMRFSCFEGDVLNGIRLLLWNVTLYVSSSARWCTDSIGLIGFCVALLNGLWVGQFIVYSLKLNLFFCVAIVVIGFFF